MIYILSTPTCQPCKTAVKILDAKGIPNQKVDLTVFPEKLASVKAKLETDALSTPTFEYEGKFYVGMQRLQEVIALAQAA